MTRKVKANLQVNEKLYQRGMQFYIKIQRTLDMLTIWGYVWCFDHLNHFKRKYFLQNTTFELGKVLEDLNKISYHVDNINIFSTRSRNSVHTALPCISKTCTKMNKIWLSSMYLEFKVIQVIKYAFYNHNWVTLSIRNRKTSQLFPNIWKEGTRLVSNT